MARRRSPVPAVEPIPGEPAAVVSTGTERVLALADYHAGLEVGLRRRGVSLPSAAEERREHLLELLSETAVDRVLVLGDLCHAIGDPEREESAELDALVESVPCPITVVKGNHDGGADAFFEDRPDVTVTGTGGTRIGRVGFAHGQTWPEWSVLESEIVCIAHEHPTVRLEDAVGGVRAERAWLRGRLDPAAFADRFAAGEYEGDPSGIDAELVVFPAFNDRTGGTWVNVEGQGFLSPFLPEGLADGEAYLLDGTRLGDYQRV